MRHHGTYWQLCTLPGVRSAGARSGTATVRDRPGHDRTRQRPPRWLWIAARRIAMHTEYHNWYSHNLGHEMTLKRYGNWGYPIVVFPAAKGSFIDYENFGMVDALRPHIESGKVQLISIGSIDDQTWENE